MRCEESVHKRYEESVMAVLKKLRELSAALDQCCSYEPQPARRIIDSTEPASKDNLGQPRDDLGRWTTIGGGNDNSQDVSQPADKFSTSEKGGDFIKRREVFRPKVYLDEGNKPTIGYGHLLQRGEKFPNGISKDEALKLLAQDIKTAETPIKGKVKVDLNQCQFDALTSFVFNMGGDAFGKSTLLQLLNQGDYNGAADQFPEWNKVTVNGVKVPSVGLTNRRKLERDLFLHGKYE